MLGLALGLGLFIMILVNRQPNLLRPMSMQARTGLGLFVPVATLVVCALFQIRNWIRPALAFAASLGLFGLSLAGLWASGQTQTVVISGLVPLTDAANYYTDALRILNAQEVSAFSGMRPIFPTVLSLVLGVTRGNLMAALAVLTIIGGTAAYLAAEQVYRLKGPIPASFFLMLLFHTHHSGQ
jgi:hypothetical protein